MTTVVIIDNHRAFGQQLLAFVRNQLHCSALGLVTEAAAGLELVRETLPDFALIDIGLPGESGLALARLLRERYPAVRVVLMGDGEPGEYVQAAAQVGAIAYLPKLAVSQQLPQLLGRSEISTTSMKTRRPAMTSRRGLVLEGMLAGGTLASGFALSQPPVALAGAIGAFLFSRLQSERAPDRRDPTGAPLLQRLRRGR